MKLKNTRNYNVYVGKDAKFVFAPLEVVEFEGSEAGVFAQEILENDKLGGFIKTEDKADRIYGDEPAPKKEKGVPETKEPEKPAKEIPAVETPAVEVPAKETPKKEQPPVEAEVPAKEAPAEEAPAEKEKVEEPKKPTKR